jgi:hypothetical protein
MINPLIVVMGDVHHHLALAAEALERLEAEFGRPIAQVFSVGDLGLFLTESDWEFLTGPKKYRQPGSSPGIRRAWEAWRWPLAMIAGNHEPFHRLREWDPGHFLGKLEYTNAGVLPHAIPGLLVAGLSGIYHPEHGEFLSPLERRRLELREESTWPSMVALVRERRIGLSRLTYFKESEVARLKALSTPHLLLLHDWPVSPPHIAPAFPRRPENEIVAAIRPPFACCGHHHTAADFALGPTRVLALNLIARTDGAARHRINPGWCAVFEWDGTALAFLRTWPQSP